LTFIWASPQWTLQKTLAATSPVSALQIKESRELFKKRSTNRSCVYMEFDPSEYPEVKYKTGDQLTRSPMNPDQEVRLFRVLGLE
jgi:NADPH-ferrihemoprotein reductase